MGGVPASTANQPIAPSSARYGEVYDRGYAHYEGHRLGRLHAVWALARYSTKRALGIKKSWTAKVIPILLYVAVALPVIVGIGIRAFLPTAQVLPYQAFMTLSFTLEGIFVATIAPEMLSSDRHDNVLALYFSRAITRLDYLVGKLLATALLTLTISWVPVVLLWLGYQLLATSPLTAMGDHLGDLWRITVGGVLIAFYLGAGGLVISSFTGRKSVAVAVIIVLFLATTALANALFFALHLSFRRYLVFFDISSTVIGLISGLFHIRGTPFVHDAGFPLWAYIVEMGAVVVLCCGIMYWRYVPHD